MMSSTSDLTIVEKAAPMMMPTAMSTTLPRSANSLNSLQHCRSSLASVSESHHPATFQRQWCPIQALALPARLQAPVPPLASRRALRSGGQMPDHLAGQQPSLLPSTGGTSYPASERPARSDPPAHDRSAPAADPRHQSLLAALLRRRGVIRRALAQPLRLPAFSARLLSAGARPAHLHRRRGVLVHPHPGAHRPGAERDARDSARR